MQEDLGALKDRAFCDLAEAVSTREIDQVRVRYLGKKGELTGLLRGLGGATPELRKTVGQAANLFKGEFARAVDARLTEASDSVRSLPETFDITRPGRSMSRTGLHPITQLMFELNDAFAALGFEVYEGSEVSSELSSFDRLNFPPDHPAREGMDTYWLDGTTAGSGGDRVCLRPHLTGASVRYMLEHEPPFRFVYPGRVYRNETVDAAHERSFFQFEALIVESSLPFSSGRLLVDTVLSTAFGRSIPTRMRAGFFPFVEPGFEIDMQCQVCQGGGCAVCKQVGWVEIMPGGPPHPEVLRAGGIDPTCWEGFYVSVGLDRLAMMRSGIDDVRLFHSGDLRFLSQFT